MAEQLASPQQTLDIYTTLSHWLYEYGSVEADDGRELLGTYLDLPIIKGDYGIDYNFSLSTKALKEGAPDFASAFEIGALAVPAYFMPAYYYPPDEGESYPSEIEHPKTCFYIQKNRSSLLESEHIEIRDERLSTGDFRIYRNIERRLSPQSCEVTHEEVDACQGEPGSLTLREYQGLKNLTYLLYFTDPESLRFESAWEVEIPKNMLLEFE